MASRLQSSLFDAAPSPAETGSVERWAHGRGLRLLVGADEVGRGPLAGPVVGAAVALPRTHGLEGLDDSKRLSARERAPLCVEIRRAALAYAVVELSAAVVDQTNILQAALRAMALAVERVAERAGRPDIVLVDGNRSLPIGFPQKTVVKGDHLSENIAAASILAKEHRDALMDTLHGAWPAYGFQQHKGYGTAAHRAALREHGPCPVHRLSFRGVAR